MAVSRLDAGLVLILANLIDIDPVRKRLEVSEHELKIERTLRWALRFIRSVKYPSRAKGLDQFYVQVGEANLLLQEYNGRFKGHFRSLLSKIDHEDRMVYGHGLY